MIFVGVDWARAHQRMIWSRIRQTNLLRSTLREFYPGALAAFGDLTSTDTPFRPRYHPTPELGSSLSQEQIASLYAVVAGSAGSRRRWPRSRATCVLTNQQLAASSAGRREGIGPKDDSGSG